MALGVTGAVAARLRAIVEVDTRGLKAGLAEANAEMEASGSKMKALGLVAKVALAGGIAIAGAAIYEGVKAASAYQAVQAKLQVALKNSGHSWKQYGGQLEDTIKRQAELSGFTENDLTTAYAKLVTVTGSVTESHKLAADAMDLSRASGKPLAQTTILVSKAYNGSNTALARMGIVLPKITKAEDALKAKKKGYTKAEMDQAKAIDLHAQRQSNLAAIQQKFGGSSAKYAKTAAGEWDRLKATFEIMEVQVGEKVLPVLTKLLTWLLAVAQSRETQVVLHAIGDAIGDVAGVVKAEVPAMMALWAQLTGWYKAHSTQIAQVMHNIARVVQWAFGQIRDVVHVAMPYVKHLIIDNLHIVRDAVQLVMDLITGKWGNAWHDIKNLVHDALDGIKTALHGFIAVAGNIAGKIGSALWGGFKSGAGSIASWVGGKVRDAINAMIGAVDSGLNVIADHWPDFPGAPGPPFGHNPIPMLASGGRVRGGRPGRDSVPALLTPGEIVLNGAQQAHMRRTYGVDVAGALGFAAGGKVSKGERRQRAHDRLDHHVQSAIGGLDYQLQLAGRIASRDDAEGNIAAEIAQLTRQQTLRSKEIKVYTKAERVAKRHGFSDLLTTYRQAAGMLNQDVLDARDTIAGLKGSSGSSGGTSSDVSAFLSAFSTIASQYGFSFPGFSLPGSGASSSSAPAAAAGGATVHVHQTIHSKVDDQGVHMRTARFAAQAAFS